jgi:thiol-disulfide isomerase/thioredoxin
MLALIKLPIQSFQAYTLDLIAAVVLFGIPFSIIHRSTTKAWYLPVAFFLISLTDFANFKFAAVEIVAVAGLCYFESRRKAALQGIFRVIILSGIIWLVYPPLLLHIQTERIETNSIKGIELTTICENQNIRLDEPSVINFWFSGCGYCKRYFKMLEGEELHTDLIHARIAYNILQQSCSEEVNRYRSQVDPNGEFEFVTSNGHGNFIEDLTEAPAILIFRPDHEYSIGFKSWSRDLEMGFYRYLWLLSIKGKWISEN